MEEHQRGHNCDFGGHDINGDSTVVRWLGGLECSQQVPLQNEAMNLLPWASWDSEFVHMEVIEWMISMVIPPK